jgi:hypothetical protein
MSKGVDVNAKNSLGKKASDYTSYNYVYSILRKKEVTASVELRIAADKVLNSKLQFECEARLKSEMDELDSNL